MNLVPAQTGGDIETARALFREYQRWFQRRTPYYANPLPGVVYWARVLLDHQQPRGPGAP